MSGVRTHDVVVIGGGPAGSTAANLLARSGRDVALFEKERFPRFHIGESLLPHNVRIFERLGVMPLLKQGFIEKWGVEFVGSNDDIQRLFHFDEAIGARFPMAFQVKRADFDRTLLSAAASAGAAVGEGTSVTAAERGGDGLWRIALEGNGVAREVRARFLIDASGRDGFLARRLGLRDMDPALKKAAIFAHFEGVPRREGRDAGNIVIVMLSDGWFWLIPFADGTTSVGLVADGARIRAQGAAPEAALAVAFERCPAARRLMKDARRLTQVYATSDWTYACRRIAGDGYLLCGDASAFIDPVFSSGVLLAMSSAEMAADLLVAALRDGDLSRRRFLGYERKVLAHVRAYRRMVDTFYGGSFPHLCFHPEQRIGLSEAVINLLAGDMEPGFRVRWRLALFYRIAALRRRVEFGGVARLHRVFEASAPGDETTRVERRTASSS